MIDRIARGQVVDFVLLHWQRFYWPAFNVADSAITVGAVLLILDSFRQRRADAPAAHVRCSPHTSGACQHSAFPPPPSSTGTARTSTRWR